MDGSWRAQVTTEARQKLIRKIIDTLQTRVPSCNQSNVSELLKIACQFEEKIFQTATDEQDYFRRISSKMITLERRTAFNSDGSLASRPANTVPSGTNQIDSTSALMQQQLLNQGQSLGSGIPMQSQAQVLTQPITGGMVSSMIQNSTGLSSSVSNISGVTQNSLNSMPGQSSISTLPGQAASQNMMITSAQRIQPLQGRQQQQQNAQQQQKAQLLYQQQFQQNFMLKQQQQLIQQQQQPYLQQQTQSQQLFDQLNSAQAMQQQQQLLQQQRLQQLQQQQSSQQQQQQQQLLQQQNQQQQQQQLLQQQNQQQQNQQQQQQQQQLLQQQNQQQSHQQETISQHQQQIQQKGSLLPPQQTTSQNQLQQKQLGSSSDPSAPIKAEPLGALEEQDLVVSKLQMLKEQYFQQLKDLYTILSTKSQQPMPADQLAKLKHYKDFLQRIIPYLTVSKEKVPKELTQAKVDTLERNIVSIMETFKRTRPSQQQQGPQDQQQAHQTQLQQQQQQSQQQREQEQKLKGGDQALSPQQQQQMVAQLQQPEKHTQHFGQSSGAVVVKPNDALPSQAHIVSTSLKGTGLAAPTGRLNLPLSNGVVDSQVNTTGTLQSVVASSVPQIPANIQSQQPLLPTERTQQHRLSKEQEQLQLQQKLNEQAAFTHMQKSREPMQQYQQGQDCKVDLKFKQAELQQALLQQQQMKQRQILQQQAFRVGSPQSVSSPQITLDNAPLSSQHKSSETSTPNIIPLQQSSKCGTPTQASPLIRLPSSSLQSVNSPQEADSRNSKAVIMTAATPGSADYLEPPFGGSSMIATPDVTPSPFFTGMSPMPMQPIASESGMQHVHFENAALNTATNVEPPPERLFNKIDTISTRVLKSAVEDIFSVISCSDSMAAPAPSVGSKAAGGEDLALTTRFRLQTPQLSDDSKSAKRKLRQYESIPIGLVLDDGNVMNSLCGVDCLEAPGLCCTRTPIVKKHKIEVYSVLKREIIETNKQLVETFMEIDEAASEEATGEGKDGIVVSIFYTCSYAFNRAGSVCGQASPWVFLPPMRLLVPPDYPHASPVILSQSSQCGSNSSVSSVRDDFIQTLRGLPPPVSLEVMAKTWDSCARDTIMHMAALIGGGSLSSTTGVWQSCKTS